MALLRLDKFLCDCHAGTRSEVKDLIRKGYVSVNGTVVKRPETKVNTAESEILLMGERMMYEPFVYYLLHKPSGVVSAVRDQACRTVVDLLKPEERKDVFPVGRLDKDTEGLLILTNDGKLCHDLLSPGKHVRKTYYAKIDGVVTDQMADAFREGIDIGDEKKTLPAELVILCRGERSEVELTICEGRFHQVRRMFEAFGQHVVYLKRTAMGGIALPEDLERGAYRRLTQEELQLLTKRGPVPGGCMEGKDVSGN